MNVFIISTVALYCVKGGSTIKALMFWEQIYHLFVQEQTSFRTALWQQIGW